MAIAQKKADAGNINDWKRFRRRPSYIYGKGANGKLVPKHQLYTPKKHDFLPRWVCLMDTSGSMGDDDIANGVKELQLVADVAEGWIVPCDAQPYWDKATKVNSKTALQRTQVVGRGGTVFEEFFRDLPKQKFAGQFDLVIIITDGDCDQVPVNLMPKGADCLWIVTNKREFRPNFGRVAQLNPSRQ
jgi:predicted metal-dependent peptidase